MPQQIIRTAVELFSKRGYRGTSLEDIATQMHLTKGAIYYHFKSKDEILFKIHAVFIDYQIERAEAAIVRCGTATEQLQAIVGTMVEAINRYLAYVKVFFHDYTELSPASAERIAAKRDQFLHTMRDVLRRGVETGEFRPELNVSVVSMAVWGMCNSVHHWYREDGKLTVAEVAQEILGMVLQGIAQPVRQANMGSGAPGSSLVTTPPGQG